MEKQDQRALSLLTALVALLVVCVFKPYVCRFRNGHQPDKDDTEAFLSNGYEKLQTKCVTCECDLELRADPEDPDLYLVVEM